MILSIPADQFRNDVRGLVIAACLIGGLILWFAIAGRSDRVIYRGVDKAWSEPGRVHLNTEPPGNYVIERNAEFDAMKIGCVYALNYDAGFGRQGHNPWKAVRSFILVRC